MAQERDALLFVESYQKILKWDMALEANVTIEGYPRFAMLGENGEFWPLGFRCTTVGLLSEAELGLFHMPTTFFPKNSLQDLGFQCIKVTPLLLKSRDIAFQKTSC